jgi:hypothetical protein
MEDPAAANRSDQADRPATSAPDDMVKILPADFGFEVAGIENRRL